MMTAQRARTWDVFLQDAFCGSPHSLFGTPEPNRENSPVLLLMVLVVTASFCHEQTGPAGVGGGMERRLFLYSEGRAVSFFPV